MPRETQVTITPEFDPVELMFDFDELALLMNDFREGFRNTVEMVEDEPSGFGGNSTRPGYDWLDDADDETFATAVRDYDYYRNNELWGKIAEELDIDMDSDDFDDEDLSAMYSFAYDQNEEYENPTFNEQNTEFPDYTIDDDDNPDTPGVVPTMDISYTNKYTDEQKTKKPAFGGNHFKVGDSMSLNLGEGFVQSGYMMTNSSGLPEDSGFKGNTNSLYT